MYVAIFPRQIVQINKKRPRRSSTYLLSIQVLKRTYRNIYVCNIYIYIMSVNKMHNMGTHKWPNWYKTVIILV